MCRQGGAAYSGDEVVWAAEAQPSYSSDAVVWVVEGQPRQMRLYGGAAYMKCSIPCVADIYSKSDTHVYR